MSSFLNIAVRTIDEVSILDLTGSISVYSVPNLKDAIIERLDSGVFDLVLNLAGVTYIDSTGLGVLVGGMRRAQERGATIRLVSGPPSITKIFDITGLSRYFTIFPSESEALAAA